MYDVFHISQLRKCVRNPDQHVAHDSIEVQPDLSYQEHQVRILEEAERRTRQKVPKLFRVQWSNDSEDEATWEREDFLQKEQPHLLED